MDMILLFSAYASRMGIHISAAFLDDPVNPVLALATSAWSAWRGSVRTWAAGLKAVERRYDCELAAKKGSAARLGVINDFASLLSGVGRPIHDQFHWAVLRNKTAAKQAYPVT